MTKKNFFELVAANRLAFCGVACEGEGEKAAEEGEAADATVAAGEGPTPVGVEAKADEDTEDAKPEEVAKGETKTRLVLFCSVATNFSITSLLIQYIWSKPLGSFEIIILVKLSYVSLEM